MHSDQKNPCMDIKIDAVEMKSLKIDFSKCTVIWRMFVLDIGKDQISWLSVHSDLKRDIRIDREKAPRLEGHRSPLLRGRRWQKKAALINYSTMPNNRVVLNNRELLSTFIWLKPLCWTEPWPNFLIPSSAEPNRTVWNLWKSFNFNWFKLF